MRARTSASVGMRFPLCRRASGQPRRQYLLDLVLLLVEQGLDVLVNGVSHRGHYHFNPAPLADSKGAIFRLLLHAGSEVSARDDCVIGGGQVESDPAGFHRRGEVADAAVGTVEPGDRLVALMRRLVACKAHRAYAEVGGQVGNGKYRDW